MTEARAGKRIEIVATAGQAAKLRGKGLAPALKRNARGETARQFDARVQRTDGSYDVYRPYFDDTYVGTDAKGRKRQTLYQDLGGFEAGPAPEGSEDIADWARSTSVGFVEGPGIATPQTLYYGFGWRASRPRRSART